ncbi:hypothetical protein M569_05690, partial [Genlisea aurea]
MGKKVKKRVKSDHRQKQSPSKYIDTLSQPGLSNLDSPVEEITVVRDRGICHHINEGITLEKLSSKSSSFASPRCENCRGTIGDRRVKKSKGKNGKKGVTPNSESKAIWICLGCGHMACGGVGLPTIPQSHAVRHANQLHHPLAVHCENHQQIWCFQCDKLINAGKIDDAESKDSLSDAVKIVKGCLAKDSSIDVEDIWFGGGVITTAVKSDSSELSRAGKSKYAVRGLINLGNTCFFNSIMQNILAINELRDHFLNLEESVGPVTAALRKIFLESEAGSGSKGVMDPKSLMGSLSSKAPQFKGYQQHDSHELLLCLLENLSAEELSSRGIQASKNHARDPTFVDAIFGGLLSNTTICSQCGHSSTNHEPFLNLSLPVPAKKIPSKRALRVASGKKQKLPPKRSDKNTSKLNAAKVTSHGESSDKSSAVNSVPDVKSVMEQEDCVIGPAYDSSAFLASISPGSVAADMGLAVDDTSAIADVKKNNIPNDQMVLDDSSRLDYIAPNDPIGSCGEMALDDSSWLDYIGPNDQEGCSVAPAAGDHAFPAASVSGGSITVDDTPAIAKLENNFAIGSGGVETTWDNFSQLDCAEPNEISDVKNEQDVEDPIKANPVVDEFHDIPLNDVSPCVVSLSFITEESSGNSHVAVPPPIDHHHIKPSSSTGLPENGFHQFEEKQNLNAEISLFSEDSFTEEIGQRDGNLGCSSQSCSNQVLPEDLDVVSIIKGGPLEMQNMVLNQDVDDDEFDFCGFGDLFGEPEASPENNPPGHSDVSRTAVFSSESSEHDEVDDEDAPVSLQSCFAYFVKPELLLAEDENGWKCDNCSVPKSSEMAANGSRSSRRQDDAKTMRDATRTTFIAEAPAILTVHLKRFSQNKRGHLSKLNGHVRFGETMDLQPYMNRSSSSRYRLVGVVEHSGNMRMGHYIAYVRGMKRRGAGEWCWYYTSDAHVREACLEQVLSSEAYILFYEK